LLEAAAAAGLIRVERADLDRGPRERSGLALDEPLCQRRRPAAAVADGLELVDELGDAEELRHRAERQTAEVLREPGGNYARAASDERLHRLDDRLVEELHLVDADDLVPGGDAEDVGRVPRGDGAELRPRVADDVG